jgi:hypothetical protein
MLVDPAGPSDPILIGPTGVGKTTVAALLGPRLGVPVVSLDRIRFGYYRELNYDEAQAARLRRESFESLIRYWQPFDAHAVVRALGEHRGCVFDFGAIHSVYDDPAHFQKVAAALAPYPNVVLLLPSDDAEESVRILHDRGKEPGMDETTLEMWRRIIRRFVSNDSNRRLAKRVVLTRSLGPEQVADRVLAACCLT